MDKRLEDYWECYNPMLDKAIESVTNLFNNTGIGREEYNKTKDALDMLHEVKRIASNRYSENKDKQ